jgi:hypothetical protein
MNYLETAKRLLGPDCPVQGHGRWCLKTPMAAYLYETREAAVASMLDPNDKYCRVFDLSPAPRAARTIGDAYDPEELRRERRERRQC